MLEDRAPLVETIPVSVAPIQSIVPVGAAPTKSTMESNRRDHDQPYNDPKCPKILTFHPTMEEFRDFEKYILFMESRNAHLGGIAKVNKKEALCGYC